MQTPHITLHAATDEDQPALRRLMQFYLYDFSEFEDIQIDEDGAFGHREFIDEQFGPAHDTYVIRAAGKLAGFAILTQGSYLSHDPGTTDMTQFFVLRAWRKQGVGASAAQQLFSLRPGPWEVRVIEKNTVARSFWRGAIKHYTNGRFTESRLDTNRHRGTAFTFAAPARG